ncbi:MAG: ribosome silencing factor [Chthoniobacterales bacterium]
MTYDPLSIALTAAQAAADKKAEDIRILDLRQLSSFADYFVICTGTSDPHLKAIGSEVKERLRDQLGLTGHADGFPASQWVVLDYLGVLIHVFQADKRAFYDLESLWRDAPVVPFEDNGLVAVDAGRPAQRD